MLNIISTITHFRRLLRRHGSSQSGCSNISLLDEIAQSYHTGVINQETVSSLPLPVPEMDTESNIDDERYQLFPDFSIFYCAVLSYVHRIRNSLLLMIEK